MPGKDEENPPEGMHTPERASSGGNAADPPQHGEEEHAVDQHAELPVLQEQDDELQHQQQQLQQQEQQPQEEAEATEPAPTAAAPADAGQTVADDGVEELAQQMARATASYNHRWDHRGDNRHDVLSDTSAEESNTSRASRGGNASSAPPTPGATTRAAAARAAAAATAAAAAASAHRRRQTPPGRPPPHHHGEEGQRGAEAQVSPGRSNYRPNWDWYYPQPTRSPSPGRRRTSPPGDHPYARRRSVSPQQQTYYRNSSTDRRTRCRSPPAPTNHWFRRPEAANANYRYNGNDVPMGHRRSNPEQQQQERNNRPHERMEHSNYYRMPNGVSPLPSEPHHEQLRASPGRTYRALTRKPEYANLLIPKYGDVTYDQASTFSMDQTERADPTIQLKRTIAKHKIEVDSKVTTLVASEDDYGIDVPLKEPRYNLALQLREDIRKQNEIIGKLQGDLDERIARKNAYKPRLQMPKQPQFPAMGQQYVDSFEKEWERHRRYIKEADGKKESVERCWKRIKHCGEPKHWPDSFYIQALTRALTEEAADFFEDIRDQPLEDILVALSTRFGAREMFKNIGDVETFARGPNESLEATMGRLNNAVNRILPIMLDQAHRSVHREQMLTQGLMNMASNSAKRKINETIATAIQQGERASYDDLNIAAEMAELTNKDMPTNECKAHIPVFAKPYTDPSPQSNALTIPEETPIINSVAKLNEGQAPDGNAIVRSKSEERDYAKRNPVKKPRKEDRPEKSRSRSRDKQSGYKPKEKGKTRRQSADKRSQQRSQSGAITANKMDSDGDQEMEEATSQYQNRPPQTTSKRDQERPPRRSNKEDSQSLAIKKATEAFQDYLRKSRPASSQRDRPRYDSRNRSNQDSRQGQDSRYNSQDRRDGSNNRDRYRDSRDPRGRDPSRSGNRPNYNRPNDSGRTEGNRQRDGSERRDFRSQSRPPYQSKPPYSQNNRGREDSRYRSQDRQQRQSSQDRYQNQRGNQRSQSRNRPGGDRRDGYNQDQNRYRDNSNGRRGQGYSRGQGDYQGSSNRDQGRQQGLGSTNNTYHVHTCPDCQVWDRPNMPAGNTITIPCTRHDPRRPVAANPTVAANSATCTNPTCNQSPN